MSAAKNILQKYYAELVKMLPMDNSGFVPQLNSHGILTHEVERSIKSQPTRADKAVVLIEHVINGHDEQFYKLLECMEHYELIRELSKRIYAELHNAQNDSKGKQKNLINRRTVLAYQQAFKNGKRRSNKFKIVLIGGEGAGKTSTADSLLGKEFHPQQPSTVGAAVQTCTADRLFATKWKQIALEHQLEQLPKQFKYELKACMSKLLTEKPTTVEEEKVGSTMQSEKQPQPPEYHPEETIPAELVSKVQEVIDTQEIHDDDVQIIILDLGGQEVYYHMHFLFLAQEDVVFLIFDASKDLDQPVICRQRLTRFQEKIKVRGMQTNIQTIEILMQSVYSHCGKTVDGKIYISNRIPTIILVATHCKGLSLQQKNAITKKIYQTFARRPFMDHLPHSLREAIFFVDNCHRDPAVFKALQMVTLNAAAPTIAKECPISYLQFEVDILKESQSRAVISKQEASTIAEKAGLQGNLMEVLNHFTLKGTLLYYPEVEVLQNEVFVSPQEVSDMISSVISTHNCVPSSAELQLACDRYDCFGLLEEKLLDDMLKTAGRYKDKSVILGFLEKFYLAVEVSRDTKFAEEEEFYDTPKAGRVFLVPSMLVYNAEVVPVRRKGDIILTYYFPDRFVPENFFNQILVNTISWCKLQNHHVHSIFHGVGYFQFKGRTQSFKLQRCSQTSSIKCYITIHRHNLGDDVLDIMLQRRQQLLDHLEECIKEAHLSHISCARPPVGYLECPLHEPEENCSPHIRLDQLTPSGDITCPKSIDCQVVPQEAYALLFVKSLKSKITPEALAQFKVPDKVNATPSLKDLYEHITPQYAADWKVIGTLLDLPSGELRAIEAGYPTNLTRCCNQMLENWLEMDPLASWEKLLTAIESPAVSSVSSMSDIQAVNKEEAVSILSNRVKHQNLQTRFSNDYDTWPPVEQNLFIAVSMSFQNCHTIEQTAAVAQSGHINLTAEAHRTKKSRKSFQNVLNTNIVTKELAVLLDPLQSSSIPELMLIEGAPGIGKTVLLKEIAYRWAQNTLLQTFKLVLLILLRDPIVHHMSSVDDLLSYFFKGDRMAREKTIACSSYFCQNGGRDMVLMLDGFDELPEEIQQQSLIADIVKRHVLPNCSLLVSSRSHASALLHRQATLTVEILGFTETEQNEFIKSALMEQPHMMKQLLDYLKYHTTIKSLCCVPFNMNVLLFLYKQGTTLPENLTELYNCFILLTIYRHFAKSDMPFLDKPTQLANLPSAQIEIIYQLSKLSLQALSDNKRVFTFGEVRATCPGIVEGINMNGFGLLQAVQHFSITGKTIKFSFLHFSIQEFLAAYYITLLPHSEQLKILEENFWNTLYLNTFVFYVGLTKGNHPPLQQFLTGENQAHSIMQLFTRKTKATSISHTFLEDPLKCIYLFRCFHEVKDENICKSICTAKFCNDKKIDLGYRRLSPSDVEALGLFLVHSSDKYWESLYLGGCQIQDHGLLVLHHGLSGSGIAIKWLQLSANGLASMSSSHIVEIGIECQVKVLRIGENNLGEGAGVLCNILSNASSTLETLGIESNSISSNVAIEIFTVLKDVNRQLKVLFIYNNNISDEACSAITEMLSINDVLEELWIGDNPISGNAAQNIVQSLWNNSTLAILRLPTYDEDVIEDIHKMQGGINLKRKDCKCQVKLDITFL